LSVNSPAPKITAKFRVRVRFRHMVSVSVNDNNSGAGELAVRYQPSYNTASKKVQYKMSQYTSSSKAEDHSQRIRRRVVYRQNYARSLSFSLRSGLGPNSSFCHLRGNKSCVGTRTVQCSARHRRANTQLIASPIA